MARPTKTRDQRKETFGPGKPPVMFDMIIPGLGVGTGRSKDRFKCSSETNRSDEYFKRREMIDDLARRFQFDLLRARLDGLFTTGQMMVARSSEGDLGIRKLRDQAVAAAAPNKPVLLIDLVDKQLATTVARSKSKPKAMLLRFIDFAGGRDRVSPADLTTDNIANFLSTLAKQARGKGQPAGPATRNRYRAALNSMCVYLVNQGLLQRNPITKQIGRLDEGGGRIPELTSSEYKLYFKYLNKLYPAFVPFMRVLAHTGLDVGEALNLNVRDAKLDRRVPRIETRRTKTRQSKVRQVPYPSQFVAELRAHIKRNRLHLGDRLFQFVRGDLEKAHVEIRAIIHRGPELADGSERDPGEVFRLKDFRHVAAVAWARANTPLHIISRWLGHSTITLTVIYTAYYPTNDEDAPFVEAAVATLVR